MRNRTINQNKSQRKLTKGILVSLGIPAVFIPGLILASVLGWNWQRDLARVAERGGFYQTLRLFPKEAVVEGKKVGLEYDEYQDELIQAEEEAKKGNLGVWRFKNQENL